MYAETMKILDQAASQEKDLRITAGSWRVFPHGSDPKALMESLAGKRSNICIADIASATAYLKAGSVEIYFSNNTAGRPVIPRAAIAIKETLVYEMRGTWNKNEDVDPYISQTHILKDRLKDIPNGELYLKADRDMRQMTELYNKSFRVDKKTGKATYVNPSLTKDDLIFLYEINSKIKNFGYQLDPRVQELRSERNPKEDALVVLECQPNEIAWNEKEITKNTKAYISPLFKDIFKTLAHLDHIYTSFPEGKIIYQEIEIGGQTEQQLETALTTAGFKISPVAQHMMRSKDFSTQKKRERIMTACFRVRDLFNDEQVHTTYEVFKRAKALALERCPAETAIYFRLNDKDQPMGESYDVTMETIAAPGRDPGVFGV